MVVTGACLASTPVSADVAGPVSAQVAPARAVTAEAAACSEQQFWDVPVSSAFCPQIGWLASTGITGGYQDPGKTQPGFHPAEPVSRQAMAAFLYRFGFTGKADPTCSGSFRAFTDVRAGGFCGPIEWLAGAVISGGYADGGFHPAAAVSRQAMAAFLYRFGNAGQAAPACTEQQFWDVPVSSAFCPQIAWLVSNGLATGYADAGKSLPGFHPTAAVSRQAMAAFLHRADAGDVIPLNSAVAAPSRPWNETIGCAYVCSGVRVTRQKSPVLAAFSTDLDDSRLRVDFEVWSGHSATPVEQVAAGSADSLYAGMTVTWTVDAELADGDYEFRIRAFDGVNYGPWSPEWNKFTVDAARPESPTLTYSGPVSTDPNSFHGRVGDMGTATITSKPEDDVYAYVYGSGPRGSMVSFPSNLTCGESNNGFTMMCLSPRSAPQTVRFAPAGIVWSFSVWSLDAAGNSSVAARIDLFALD